MSCDTNGAYKVWGVCVEDIMESTAREEKTQLIIKNHELNDPSIHRWIFPAYVCAADVIAQYLNGDQNLVHGTCKVGLGSIQSRVHTLSHNSFSWKLNLSNIERM